MTESATITTLEHGDPSRMPDTNWLWRRVLIYAVTLWGMAMATWMAFAVYQIAMRSAPPATLIVLGVMGNTLKWGFWTAWGGLILYGVAASVGDLALFAAAVRTSVKQTITTAPPPASITTSAAGDTKVSTPAAAAGPDPSMYGGPRP